MYGFEVQDIGKDAYHVTVEVFRNEPILKRSMNFSLLKRSCVK